MEGDVDNLFSSERKRHQLIRQIQAFLAEGCSYREIAKRMGIGRNTIAKYRKGDPEKLCRFGSKQSKLDAYYKEIMDCLKSGYSKSYTVKRLYALGYTGAKSTAFDHLAAMERSSGLRFEPQPYVRTYTEALKYKTGSAGQHADYLTRSGIFRWLWMDEQLLTENHKQYLLTNYRKLAEIRNCIRQFRRIFIKKSMPELYLFIERYRESNIPEFKTFAKGLLRDLEAVENAVASELSNGFVEGTNNKLKMIKRTMYGRCNPKLLSAKLMLQVST